MTAQYNTTSNSFNLPIITKSGYTCKWAKGSASGTKYVGGTSQTVTSNTTYYAVCEAPTFGNISYMQEMTTSICESVAIGASTSLRDIRNAANAPGSRTDGQYTVAKLADGKCWMTDSLRLTTNQTFTPQNSDISEDFFLRSTNNTEGNTDWCEESEPTEDCVNRTNTMGESTRHNNDRTYGFYYSWAAATAGTGTYSTITGDAPSSICPKGWRLPTGAEFTTLYGYYNSYSAITGSPVYLSPGGHVVRREGAATAGISAIDIENGGLFYWSSTPYDNTGALAFRMRNSTDIYPASNLYKMYGAQIRCVAR